MRFISTLLLLAACGSDPETTPTDGDDDTSAAVENYGTTLQRGVAGTAISSSGYVCGSGTSTCDTTACASNTAPVLGTPLLVVNGVVATSASIGDHVEILVPYEDSECNAGCGGVQVYFEGPSMAADSDASSCDDQPCGTSTSGVYLGVGFGTVDQAGSYSASFRMTDACGDRSAPADLSFTL